VTLTGSIVDGEALLQVLWVSFAAGIGVTVVFAVALVGATRAVDMSRDGRAPESVAYAVLALVAAAGVAAAVVLAIVVMTTK
jgi:Na+/melibiose symporter-like transporter